MMSNLIKKVVPPGRESGRSLKRRLLEVMYRASSPTEMRDIAARICRDYLTGAWKTISAEELQLRRISGGLSNFLYYVSLPDHHYYSHNSSVQSRSNASSPRGSISGPDHQGVITNTSTKLKSSSNGGNNKRARKDSYTACLPEPKEVLLRIYGQTHGEHALETMLTESVVFTLLSERKLGPKLHGIFPGGRIEQYIPARALLTAELGDPKISLKVAERMAAIHTMDIPVSKEPDWLWAKMAGWLKGIAGTLETMERDRANGNANTSPTAGGFGDGHTMLDILAEIDLAAEVQWLRSLISSEDFPVVFCHNDLQEGNILLRQDEPSSMANFECNPIEAFDESTQLDSHFSGILISSGIVPTNATEPLSHGNQSATISLNSRNSRKRSLEQDHMENSDLDNTRDSVLSGNSQPLSEPEAGSNTDGTPELMIIDFEYCAYNYRGFDLANHFLEWTFDYTNRASPYFYHKPDQYPTYEQQEKFIIQYLTHLSCPGDARTNKTDEEDEDDLDEQDRVSETGSSTMDEVEQIRREVQCFTMVSHLFWSLWAIVNVYQQIEFGYMEYAACRLKQYRLAKKFYTEMMMGTGSGSDGSHKAPSVDPEK
ncbi:choline/ethanolamine kinase isoform X2 [Anopheles darlingi]|uniref:choline/ethanolamine kinase isoform X2 n=1 Tax=Anopheles darlingi TaxID=43151 RepID=UPI0021005D67|nr:choline/ethanolamine kinase isoform X2 [Anopheles darlingi]